MRYVAEGAESVGQLLDVSRSGVSIRAAELPRPGAIVALQFESPVGKLVDVRGEVRWSQCARDGHPDGFGVRLHEPPREFRDFVEWALSHFDLPGDEADDGDL